MSTTEARLEQAPDPPGQSPELKAAINGRCQDLYAHAIALVSRRCMWMRPDARKDRAESIVQEAVSRAWQHRDKFDPKRQPIAWLMGFVNNVALEQLGKTKHVNSTDLSNEAWTQAMAGLIAPTTDSDDLELLRRARQKLGPDHQRIITLAYDEHLDGAELAERLGVSEGAARVAKTRALQALRKNFHQLDRSGGQKP